MNEIEKSAGQEIGPGGDHGNATPMEFTEISGRALDFPQDVGRRSSQFFLNPRGPGEFN